MGEVFWGGGMGSHGCWVGSLDFLRMLSVSLTSEPSPCEAGKYLGTQ